MPFKIAENILKPLKGICNFKKVGRCNYLFNQSLLLEVLCSIYQYYIINIISYCKHRNASLLNVKFHLISSIKWKISFCFLCLPLWEFDNARNCNFQRNIVTMSDCLASWNHLFDSPRRDRLFFYPSQLVEICAAWMPKLHNRKTNK